MPTRRRHYEQQLTTQQDSKILKDVWLDSQEVMQRLHCSARTLHKLRKSKKLPYYKLGGKIYYKESEVNAMIEQCRVIH